MLAPEVQDRSIEPNAPSCPIDAIMAVAGSLPQIALEFEEGHGILWLTIKPEPKPVFTRQMLGSVVAVQEAIAGLWGNDPLSSPVRFLAYRGEGSFFTLGGDLDFILKAVEEGDHDSLRHYATIGARGAVLNANGLDGVAVTISTIHAKALGGGIDAPRSCHVMIAEEAASFQYPEIKFNHFPITAPAVLVRRIGLEATKKVLLSGAEYSAREFHAMGGVEEVVEPGGGEAWIRDFVKKTAPSHRAFLGTHLSLLDQDTFERDLRRAGDLWFDCMIAMSAEEIAKLRKISAIQDKMLARLKG